MPPLKENALGMCLCAHTLPESAINSNTTIPFSHPPSVDHMGAFSVHSSSLPSPLFFNSIVTNDASLVCCSLMFAFLCALPLRSLQIWSRNIWGFNVEEWDPSKTEDAEHLWTLWSPTSLHPSCRYGVCN